MKTFRVKAATTQSGFTLTELMVSLLIAATVMAGVVQMLVVSKSNFITARELAMTQENARYAMKFIADEIKMAGFTGCSSTPLYLANSVNGSDASWYMNGTGLQGYEYEAGVNTFPAEFRTDVAANTDALVIRRTENTGLRVTAHTASSANIALNKAHSYKPGQVMVITSRDCQHVGIFQITAPVNNGNNATHMVHNTGNVVAPGNCTKLLGENFTCANVGDAQTETYLAGASVGALRSEAYYIGTSGGDASVPALYRERMLLDTVPAKHAIYTAAEELVKGVENIQILYGLDTLGDDGIADLYAQASPSLDWDSVVSIRLSIRMRSLLPVYNEPVEFGEFEGAAGTDGSDRFMRQDITTTINIRNS